MYEQLSGGGGGGGVEGGNRSNSLFEPTSTMIAAKTLVRLSTRAHDLKNLNKLDKNYVSHTLTSLFLHIIKFIMIHFRNRFVLAVICCLIYHWLEVGR